MEYFILGQESFVDEDGEPYGYYYVGPQEDEYTEFPWLGGVRFESPPPDPLVLHIDSDDADAGGFADFVSGPVPLVTERLRQALLDAGAANLEFFPVLVEGAADFDDCPKYHAINIVGKVAASDPSKSSGLEAMGGMGATLFDKFVPAVSALQDLVIVRMAENLGEVIVSARVRKSCARRGVDTVTFVPISEWRRE